jgi:hypothetical protein
MIAPGADFGSHNPLTIAADESQWKFAEARLFRVYAHPRRFISFLDVPPRRSMPGSQRSKARLPLFDVVTNRQEARA